MNVPGDIKRAASALIISLVATLLASYIEIFQHDVPELLAETMPFIGNVLLSFNALWSLIIAWLVWDIFRGEDIKWSIILVGLVMLAFLVWDTIDYGFGLAQALYALELVMFVVAYVFITTPESKAWFIYKKNAKTDNQE